MKYEMRAKLHLVVEWEPWAFNDKKWKDIVTHSNFLENSEKNSAEKKNISIYDCLNLWSAEEKLTAKNTW